MSDEQRAQELISIFVCKKDNDIENFLKERAILFEKLGKSRTFLIYDEDDEEFKVLAYLTIALQVLKIPESLSNRKIKNFDGFSAKINGKRITEFPAILIGQVGKNDLYKDKITGFEIMQYCLSTILDGQMRLGGRIITLECKNIPYLIDFYKQFGFVKLEKDYKEDELLQLIKILREDELIEKDENRETE
jgi:predicted GNAT family N-acyltransferase